MIYSQRRWHGASMRCQKDRTGDPQQQLRGYGPAIGRRGGRGWADGKDFERLGPVGSQFALQDFVVCALPRILTDYGGRVLHPYSSLQHCTRGT